MNPAKAAPSAPVKQADDQQDTGHADEHHGQGVYHKNGGGAVRCADDRNGRGVLHNMLKITSDGRKIGLDQRLMNSALPDDPNSKLNACVNNVLRIWNDTKEQKLTQLIFCDMSTPKGDGSFNVYDDILTKLLNSGVPEQEIEFIHNADTENKKAEQPKQTSLRL